MSPQAIPRPAKRTVLSGIVGGILHLSLVSALWLWFGFTNRLVGNELLLLSAAIGAFTVGAIPSALLYAKRLRVPLIIVIGLFVASVFSNWATYVAQSPTPTPVGPTAFGWYLLGWLVVLGVALFAGGVEILFRRRWRKRRAESTSP
jgi:energy-coupling factor transporter transmembrane protein EcfT